VFLKGINQIFINVIADNKEFLIWNLEIKSNNVLTSLLSSHSFLEPETPQIYS